MLATVYTKDNCLACVQLKARFNNDGQEYVEVKIGTNITREEFMEKFPNVRTVPHVVYSSE